MTNSNAIEQPVLLPLAQSLEGVVKPLSLAAVRNVRAREHVEKKVGLLTMDSDITQVAKLVLDRTHDHLFHRRIARFVTHIK